MILTSTQILEWEHQLQNPTYIIQIRADEINVVISSQSEYGRTRIRTLKLFVLSNLSMDGRESKLSNFLEINPKNINIL